MESVPLYRFEDGEIKVSIDAYFDGDFLVIDGYDIGKRVEEYWGDSDYEYMVRIPLQGVEFISKHLKVNSDNKSDLLHALAQTFNTNTCYSDIRKLMSDNGIHCEGFTWT